MYDRRLLIIDDEPEVAELFRLFLGGKGYEILVSKDGESGFSTFAAEYPAVVFTAAVLADAADFEIIRRIKTLAPKTEVIALIEHQDFNRAFYAVDMEASDFLFRPIQREALETVLVHAEKRRTAGGETGVGVIRIDNVTIVTVTGNVTGDTITGLETGVSRAAKRKNAPILLRFEPHARINGDGVRYLIKRIAELTNRGHPVGVTGISDNVRMILELAGVKEMADLFETETAALQALN
jgi:DNA-binding response OmpR family regulator